MNLSLSRPNAPFELHDPVHPLYTRPRFLPGSTINGATLKHVLLADGCRIGTAEIRDSVIGLRSQVGDRSFICDSILMGADFYDPPDQPPPEGIPLGIGPDCRIEGAIIDKNARLGAEVHILPFPNGTEIEGETWVVRDGIVVIPKNTVLSAGTVIGP